MFLVCFHAVLPTEKISEAGVPQKVGLGQQPSVAVGSPVDARAEHPWHTGGHRISCDSVTAFVS